MNGQLHNIVHFLLSMYLVLMLYLKCLRPCFKIERLWYVVPKSWKLDINHILKGLIFYQANRLRQISNFKKLSWSFPHYHRLTVIRAIGGHVLYHCATSLEDHFFDSSVWRPPQIYVGLNSVLSWTLTPQNFVVFNVMLISTSPRMRLSRTMENNHSLSIYQVVNVNHSDTKHKVPHHLHRLRLELHKISCLVGYNFQWNEKHNPESN